LGGFRGHSREEFHGWLRTVFRRAYARWAWSISKQRVHAIACPPESPLIDRADDSSSLKERVMAAERDLRIMAVTTELPAKFRLILWIRLHCKMPFAEIAGVLGINKKTAETRYYRAVERLRRQLEKSKDES
jgi:RNA polymerase sigma factor (sigma-70 family)